MPYTILDIDSEVPEQDMTNKDLENIVDTNDEWIRQRTGMTSSKVAEHCETPATLAHKAAKRLLERNNLKGKDIDYIFCGGNTPYKQKLFPATSNIIAGLLDTNCGANDVQWGCAGWLAALRDANNYLYGEERKKNNKKPKEERRVLVVGTEIMSKYIDYKDRATCVLFGDGAGVALLGYSQTGEIFQAYEKTTPDMEGVLTLSTKQDLAEGDEPYLGREIFNEKVIKRFEHKIMNAVRMDGNDVFKFAVRAMKDSTNGAAEHAGITLEEIDIFIPHGANHRIITPAIKSLRNESPGLRDDTEIYVTLERHRNMSAASIPVSLSEFIKDYETRHLLKHGEGIQKLNGKYVAMAAFGAGLGQMGTIVKL